MESQDVYDVVVIGGGIFGSWAAIALERFDCSRVALVDQFFPGHENGSSHGDGRIYRSLYADDVYVDMMKHSVDLWNQLNDYTSGSIMLPVGCIALETCDGPWSVNRIFETATRMNVEHELLNDCETKCKFPMITAPDGRNALYTPDGGVLRASECVKAAWSWAKTNGVHTFTQFKVTNLNKCSTSSSVWSVEAEDRRILYARKIIIAAGSWLSEVTKRFFGIDVKARITEETVCYYKPYDNIKHAADHTPYSKSNAGDFNGLPTFLFQMDNGLSPFGYYGLPDLGNGLKVGSHCTGGVVSSNRSETSQSYLDTRSEIVVKSCNMLIERHFPFLSPTPVKTQRCLYTCSENHDFVISRIPKSNDDIVIVGCGSGHGFKFAPTVGYCAAALVLGKETAFDLTRFTMDRIIGTGFEDEIVSR